MEGKNVLPHVKQAVAANVRTALATADLDVISIITQA